MARAIALTGAIVESENGRTMTYLKRCTYCGDVPNSGTTTSIPSIGNTLVTSASCNNCRRTFEIKIKGA